ISVQAASAILLQRRGKNSCALRIRHVDRGGSKSRQSPLAAELFEHSGKPGRGCADELLLPGRGSERHPNDRSELGRRHRPPGGRASRPGVPLSEADNERGITRQRSSTKRRRLKAVDVDPVSYARSAHNRIDAGGRVGDRDGTIKPRRQNRSPARAVVPDRNVVLTEAIVSAAFQSV